MPVQESHYVIAIAMLKFGGEFLSFCFAIILQAPSYIFVLWIPIPQKMAKASKRPMSDSTKRWSRS
jgi:hypothetical protein